MPGGRGPLPKPTSSRDSDFRRKNADARTVTSDDEVRGPDLPNYDGYRSDGTRELHVWHPQTIKWWETWRRSPLSKVWLATDWDFLLDTALMHSAMWSAGNWTMAAEVRLRVAKLGATYEDRLRLKISVDLPAKVEKPSVSVMEEYRQAAG